MTFYHQTKSGKVLKFTFNPQVQTGTLNTLEYRYRGDFLEFFHNGTEVFPPESIYQAVRRFQQMVSKHQLSEAA